MMEFGYEDRVVMQRLKTLGFSPACICDVGACTGGWTNVVSEVFPEAHFHMFEPLADLSSDYQKGLQSTVENTTNCTLHPFALGEKCEELMIGLSADFFSSSFLIEQETDHFPSSVPIKVMTLDEVVQSFNVPQPQMLKMDTQGYELEILKGAIASLKHLEVILIEGWLTRGYGPRTPLMMEVANWLAQHDFFLFDFGGEYRLESGVLIAKDAFFVKSTSPLESLRQERHFKVITDEAELQSVQSALQEAQAKLSETQAELTQREATLQQHQNEIEAMKTSKFWKMRTAWFNFKALFQGSKAG